MTNFEITAICERVLVKQYLNVVKDGVDYTIKVCNGNVIGIYKQTETRKDGYIYINSEYMGKAVKQMFGLSKKELLEIIEEEKYNDEY